MVFGVKTKLFDVYIPPPILYDKIVIFHLLRCDIPLKFLDWFQSAVGEGLGPPAMAAAAFLGGASPAPAQTTPKAGKKDRMVSKNCDNGRRPKRPGHRLEKQ